MSQTTVNDYPNAVFEGMADHIAPGGVISALCRSEGILVGKAGGRRDGDVDMGDNGLGGQQVEGFAAANAADNLIGIAMYAPQIETDPAKAYLDYVDGDAVPLLKRGRIWVTSADAVDDLTKSVFVRNAAASTLPGLSLGSFRATTAANYIDLGALFSVRWVAGRTQGGIEYGLLEINLP